MKWNYPAFMFVLHAGSQDAALLAVEALQNEPDETFDQQKQHSSQLSYWQMVAIWSIC